ncbi:SAC3/GANP/Nin1/mts3/eIF-3 p25 family/COP9 signalosome, subunit CSN8 [Novymonas esmeraldas]|uniref:SAC3/GANP/Nin1/mts3/eIF-3 p25 family/COP9 signalosome, subunit CSN8 n=1 Tax=Novymonas esmeraldas TaxID=1808958 RepID=A0AAW0EZK7_9TRYP
MARDDGAQVAQLLSEGKYNLPMFLRYLKASLTDGDHPDKSLLLGILLQSLARFQTSDFTACMCLVPSHVQDSPSVEKELNYIYGLENLLSCGLFARFWWQWNSVKEHLPESFHFESRVRTSILETVCTTMESIPVEKLAAYLAVSPDQVQKVVQNAMKDSEDRDMKVMAYEGGSVVFHRNRFNYPQAGVAQEAIRFSDVSTVIYNDVQRRGMAAEEARDARERTWLRMSDE